MAKVVTEVALGAAAIGMAIAMPGIGMGLAWMTLGMQNAIIGSLVGIGASEVMAGVADALKGNQGGLAVGVTSPIGPWGVVYGTQKVGGIEIFRESNNNTGASGSTSNDKQLHRVYCLASHPCALGSWQLRIDGKQVLLQASGTDWVSYSPTQTTLNISSISRTNGVVTMVLSGSMPAATAGTTLQMRSVSDNTYNGTFTVTQPNPADFTTWSYVCGGPNSTSSGGNARTTYSDYKDKIRVSMLNGNHTATFPTLLAAGTTWGASDLCLGRTLAYVQMGYDSTVFPSSIPNVSFVIDGKNNIWDPRSSTYGFTKNPALIIADYLCMPTIQGGFGLTMGTDVPAANLIAAANKCDETVLLDAGGTTPRYTCNTYYSLNSGRGTILKTLLSSCAGRISYQGGQYSIQPGQWVAPTLSLTDADLVGPIKWRPRFSIRDTCNAVKGTYVSPENAYQQADVPAYMQDVDHGYVSDPWLAEDNGERIFREINFSCTDSSAIAQRLEKIALLRTRFQGRGTIRCSLRAYQAVALDTIQITHAHYSWVNKVFEVTASRFVLDKSGDTPLPVVELDIAETDSSIWNWTPTEQLTPQGYMQPNNVGTRICAPPEQVIAYSGIGGMVNGITCPSTVTTRGDGTVSNSIYVEWTAPNDGNVVHGGHIEVQWQAATSGSWASLGQVDPSVNHAFVTNVSDGINYNIQVRAVNAAGVPSDWIQASPYPVTVSVSQMSIPAEVSNVVASEGPYKTDAGLVSLVAVSFTPGTGFASAQVYFTGYNGSATPQLMATGTTSPIEFLCNTTHETVMVSVLAVDQFGVPASASSVPTVYLTLNGVATAPPYPSIAGAQSALDNGSGWQFTFNIVGGLEFDLISGYRIYHSENAADTSPAYYETKAQPPTNVGTITVQEVSGDLLWYWVSAISTSGLESILTAVPFQYVDPGAAPPTSLTPVATTQVYKPALLTNGWAAGAHVQYCETQNATNGTTFSTCLVATSPYNNPASAYDGNQSTAASQSQAHNSIYAGCIWTFSNNTLTTGATTTGATLNIVSDVLQTSGISGECSIWYSLDGGTTWINVYTDMAHPGSARAKQTDTVTLPSNVNPALLQVMANFHSHDDIQHDVYEINLAVTQSTVAGPEQVTGVAASLVSGNINLKWNGLIPLSRADLMSYQVYRAPHGAGYTLSHLETTITPTGAATYTWIDAAGHDGSWDYWVIAQNHTGYSPASIVATLFSGGSLLYLNGKTAEDLRPAQANADVTSSNTAADTSNVNGLVSSRVSTLALGSSATGQEMLTNGGFENGLTGWLTQSGTPIIDTTTAYMGTQSVKLPPIAGGASDVYQHCLLVPGHIYQFQTWVKTDGNATINGWGAGFYLYDPTPMLALKSNSGGVFVDVATHYPGVIVETTAAIGWTLLQMTITTPVQGIFDLHLSASYGNSGTSGCNVWFDAASLIDITAGNNMAAISDGGGRYAAGEAGANVTSAHAITVAVNQTGSVNLTPGNGTWYPLGGLAWSAQTASSGDTYNITGTLTGYSTNTNMIQFNLALVIDGNTASPKIQQAIFAAGAQSGTSYYWSAPFVMGATGLTVGSHTLALYVQAIGGAYVSVNGGTYAYAICQRVF